MVRTSTATNTHLSTCSTVRLFFLASPPTLRRFLPSPLDHLRAELIGRCVLAPLHRDRHQTKRGAFRARDLAIVMQPLIDPRGGPIHAARPGTDWRAMADRRRRPDHRLVKEPPGLVRDLPAHGFAVDERAPQVLLMDEPCSALAAPGGSSSPGPPAARAASDGSAPPTGAARR